MGGCVISQWQLPVSREVHGQFDGGALHEFEGAGLIAVHEEPGDGPAGVGRIGERNQQQGVEAWPRQQLQGRLRDDAEGALRPDHKLGQVVPGAVLQGVGSGSDDGTVGQHDLEIEDPILGDAVLDGSGASAVLSEVASDGAGAPASGVDGIEEAFVLHGLLHFLDDDAGLDDELVMELVNADDPVEPFGAESNAPAHGKGSAAEAGPRSGGRHGHPASMGPLHYRRDLCGAGRKDDDVREELKVLGVVAAVGFPGFRCPFHEQSGHGGLQGFRDRT